MKDSIKVQANDFDVAAEYQALTEANREDGAVVFFVGRMREFNQGSRVNGMFLEHYPAMTKKALEAIVQQAHQRFEFNRCRLVHRVGQLHVEDQIVFVGVSSSHREQAFAAAEFIMDYLKTRAPFWKKETTIDGIGRWVEAHEKDQKAAERWQLD